MHRLSLAPVLGALALVACSEGYEESDLEPLVGPVYAPSQGLLPVPNDLLFSGSTDATLNIPVEDAADLSDPSVALNGTAGWSTAAPWVIQFDGPIDFTTAVAGGSVRLFQVTVLDVPGQPFGTPVTGITAEVTDFTVEEATEDSSGSTLRVVPTSLLTAGASYMVVVTDGITGSDGRRQVRSSEYALASAEEPYPEDHPFAGLQLLVGAMQQVAAGAGIERDSITLSYTFTTQAGGSTLSNLRLIAADPSGTTEGAIIAGLCDSLPSGCVGEDTTPDPRSVASIDIPDMALGSTLAFLGAGPGAANIYQGGLTLAYYLAPSSNADETGLSNDPAALQTRWQSRFAFAEGDTDRNVTRFNPLPAIQAQEQVPVLVSLPNAGPPPAGGWPVAIFQHGVTRNRGDVLLVADALAAAGIAAIAIDLPLHGIPENTADFPSLDLLFEGYQDGTVRERTFGIDLVNNETGAAGPDGSLDSSGTHYINLANFLAIRDNLRQSATDLFQLEAVLGDVDLVDNGTGADGADTNPDFDLSRVHFFGYSLGAIVASSYLAETDAVVSATLAMPGMALPYLLDASPTFGPEIRAGLEAKGVFEGTPDYTGFLFAAQTAIEQGDSLAFTSALAASGLPIHLIEVIGGGAGGGLPDQTVPNTSGSSPLGGTEPFITALGLDGITNTESDAGGVSGAVRFIEGTHGSLISPGDGDPAELAAYLEMQTQVATFAATSGTTIQITDGTVISNE